MDPQMGILQGRCPEKPGEYRLAITAKNGKGQAQRPLKIIAGKDLALTPPMGWSSWYAYSDRINEPLIRKTAESMILTGLADFGYQYVSIDDCWMNKVEGRDSRLTGTPRNAQGAILPNRLFPDMKGLVDFIHSKGLRAGIYSSPGPYTCQVYVGSYRHEEIDARQFSSWGFDLLKYDWCSYAGVAEGEGLPRAQAPFRLIGGILQRLDRDILFCLCQYGKDQVWKWGREVGGQIWRTSGDLSLEPAEKLPAFYGVARKNAPLYAFAGPGGWNDPDYLMLGFLADPENSDAPAKKTALSAEEQYSYMSLWSLMAAPLFFSGDVNRLDAFTLNVLCNAEILEINQDAMGKQAKPIQQSEKEWIFLKPMEDGSWAVGLFNLSEENREIQMAWKELGLTGPQYVRDVWRQRDLGLFRETFGSAVAPHGCLVLRVKPPVSP